MLTNLMESSGWVWWLNAALKTPCWAVYRLKNLLKSKTWQKQLLWSQCLCLLEMTQNGRCKMVPNGRLGLPVKAKDGRPKCPSAALKSIWLSTRAIDCICKLALRVLAGRKKKTEKQKKPEHCVSKFRTQRAISLFSCLFYSKCHSVSESAFRALRQRCRCSGLNIYNHGQMGWVSRELRRGV